MLLDTCGEGKQHLALGDLRVLAGAEWASAQVDPTSLAGGHSRALALAWELSEVPLLSASRRMTH